jgi:hypothetical protein
VEGECRDAERVRGQGRKESPRSEVRVIRQWMWDRDGLSFFSGIMRGVLRKRM